MNLLSPWHILVVLVVVLLVFGPDKIPEVARQLGNGMRQFRDIQATLRGEISDLLDIGDDDSEAPTYSSPPESPNLSDRPSLPAPRPYRAPATNGMRSGASMPSRYRAPDGRRLSLPAPSPAPAPPPRPVVAVPAAPVARRQAPSRFRSPRPPGPSTNGSS